MIGPDELDSPIILEDSSSIIGGAVDNAEAHLLRPDQVAYLLNMRPTIEGQREKLLGVDAIGFQTGDPRGLFPFEVPLRQERNLVALYGNSLYITPGNDVLSQKACGVSFCATTYGGVMGRGATNSSTLFLHTAVGVTDNSSLPFGNLICLDRGWGVTEVSTMKSRAYAWFQSRLWALNSCMTLLGPDYLQWSGPFDGRDFSSGQNVQIESDTGDQGMVLVPMRDATPRLLIGKERSIHLLEVYWKTDGYYTTTQNQMDFTKSLLRPITLETGMVSSRGVVWAPGIQQADLLFLSREGIRSLQRSLTDAQGGAGIPLSFRIQKTIDRINWRTAERSVAAYWDGIVYFAVPVDGAVEPNFIIAYDIFRDAFFYRDLSVIGWTPCQLTAERRFFFQSGTAHTEPYSGGSLLNYAFHVYNTDVGTYNPGSSPVPYEEHTRAFTAVPQNPSDGLKIRKRWRFLDTAVQAGNTCATLSYWHKIDETDTWQFLDYLSVDPADAYPPLPVQLPFTVSSHSKTRKKISLHHLQPGYKIRFRILDNQSYARIKILQFAVAATPYGVTFD